MSRQFRRPHGLLGHWAVRFMERNNRVHYGKTIRLLELHSGDSVLEIGYGSGLAIQEIVRQHPDISVCGVDFSRLMYRKAVENNQVEIQRKQVELHCGDLLAHDFGSRTFTRIFGINVVYFWDDLPRTLQRLRRLLQPAGRLVLFMSSPERLNTIPFAVDAVFHKRSVELVKDQLRQAGFVSVDHQTESKNGMDTYYVSAQAPANFG